VDHVVSLIIYNTIAGRGSFKSPRKLDKAHLEAAACTPSEIGVFSLLRKAIKSKKVSLISLLIDMPSKMLMMASSTDLYVFSMRRI
jgi:hypothetical protein